MFTNGQQVRAIGVRGCYALTEGKVYTVQEYIPEYYDNTSSSGYTWPAYVTVIDDYGHALTCHASRFETIEE